MPFPGESSRYRTARNKLLAEETELRRHVERVARMRRKLPLGGPVKEDYVFDSGAGRQVKLSELFRDGKDTLLIYSYMFGPMMAQPCPMCTSFLDSIEGAVDHFTQSPLLSSAGNSYNIDYHGENAAGGQLPMMNVFVRRKGKIHHSYATELQFMPPDKGRTSAYIDMMWPLWNMLDLTPEGRGDFFPSLDYSE